MYMFRDCSCGHVHVCRKSVDVDHLVMKLCRRMNLAFGGAVGCGYRQWLFVIIFFSAKKKKKIRVFKAMYMYVGNWRDL